MPQEVRRASYSISLAARYNRLTGASLSHLDVDKMGYNESFVMELALDLLGGDSK
jgi:hypothetical protein